MKTEKEMKEMTMEEKIESWKKEWGKIFKTGIGDQSFIWRKLKRKEYTEIMSMTDSISKDDPEEQILERTYERQKGIAKKVILYPENIEELVEENCGLSSSIADLVMYKSGFVVSTDTEEL